MTHIVDGNSKLLSFIHTFAITLAIIYNNDSHLLCQDCGKIYLIESPMYLQKSRQGKLFNLIRCHKYCFIFKSTTTYSCNKIQ